MGWGTTNSYCPTHTFPPGGTLSRLRQSDDATDWRNYAKDPELSGWLTDLSQLNIRPNLRAPKVLCLRTKERTGRVKLWFVRKTNNKLMVNNVFVSINWLWCTDLVVNEVMDVLQTYIHATLARGNDSSRSNPRPSVAPPKTWGRHFLSTYFRRAQCQHAPITLGSSYIQFDVTDNTFDTTHWRSPPDVIRWPGLIYEGWVAI